MWHNLTKQQCGWSNTTKPTIPNNNLHGTNVKVTYVIPTHTTSISTSFVESVACRDGNNSRSICSARNNSLQLLYYYLERKRSTYMYQNMRVLRHSFTVIDLGYGLMGKRWSDGWWWLKQVWLVYALLCSIHSPSILNLQIKCKTLWSMTSLIWYSLL